MNLTDYLPHITAAAVTGALTGAVDHLISESGKLIPNSAWQLAKAFIFRKPIRAKQEVAKGEEIMFKFLDEFEEGIKRMDALAERGLNVLGKLALFTEKAAPLAAAVAPLTGSAAPAVTAAAALASGLAPLVEKVAEDGQGRLAEKDPSLTP